MQNTMQNTKAKIRTAATCFIDYGHDLCELYEDDNAQYFLQHCCAEATPQNIKQFYVAVKQLFADYTQQV